MTEIGVEPHVFVIFGATGDLSRRNLLPAVAALAEAGRMGEKHIVLGISSRPEFTDGQFRDLAFKALEKSGLPENTLRSWCTDCLYAHSIGESKPKDFEGLRKRIEDLEKKIGLPGNRLFYLSTPPSVFASTIEGLGEAGMNDGPGWSRLVIEKPFGRDLKSAQELNDLVHRYFRERQVYRIDHYLGKETVQNLFVFRFANMIFESLWNRDRIAGVDILVGEDMGIEGRARFYEKNGAVRDILQNHAIQLVSLIGMEAPPTADPEAVRGEKIKLMQSILPLRDEDVVLGQYTAGASHGKAVPGYREEDGVDPNSNTETFAAVRLFINNWRWQGVPFLVRTGKRLKRRLTQISVTFREVPVSFFKTMGHELVTPNGLTLRLQPDEGFELGIQLKEPGDSDGLRIVPLSFSYADAFGKLPTAYETLLQDVIVGDQTLFVHAVETEAAWKLFAPLLDRKKPVSFYQAGSWGPYEVAKLMMPGQETLLR